MILPENLTKSFDLSARVLASLSRAFTLSAPWVMLTSISETVAVCSSVALAIVFARSFTLFTLPVIFSTAETASPIPWVKDVMIEVISSVAWEVCFASSFTSFATTAKPFPASPALAASIVAFRAKRFVCSAMLFITPIM